MKIKMSLKNFKLKNLLLFALLTSSCGGGGGSPSLVSNIPVIENNFINNEIQTDIYVPKENFETPEYKSQWGLDSINASSAYSLGGTGEGIVVGVIDEALDWGHHEFLREGILHPDSVLTYSGNREPTPLEKFHGTATSSIIAGRKDNTDIPKNMHGIAFDSQILFIAIELGSPPEDGDYEPLEIEEFSWEAYDAREALFYKDISSRVDVVNNSFGFVGQITDYSKEQLQQTFPKFIKTLGEEQDTIFVWSAGNYNGILDTNGDPVSASNPGLLAGLGYYFPKLETNNVAVVAIDSNGKIADFSNRCGVTQNFCIAAPGVGVPLAIPNNLFVSLSENEKSGFNQGVLDYLKDHPAEAYLSGSGTSFSAPHVTGSLAVLFDLFKGNLSNAQILQRLFDSANKKGEYSNKEIYGQGVLDLGAASSPIGIPLFYTNGSIYGGSISLNDSFISTGKSFGDSLEMALGEKNISFFDALGAPFFVTASNFINTKIPSSKNSKRIFNFNKNIYDSFSNGIISQSSWQSVLNSQGISGYRLHNAKLDYIYQDNEYSLSYGLNPSLYLFNSKFFQSIDRAFNDNEAFVIPWTKASEEGFNIGFSQKFRSQILKINFFSGSRREDEWFLRPTFSLQHDGKTNGASFTITDNNSKNYQKNFIFGFMNHKEGFFDNNFNGAFKGPKGGKSFYSAINFNTDFKNNWNFISTFSLAKVNNIGSNKFIKNISGVLESHFDIGIYKENFLLKNDYLSFRLRQEPRIERAKLIFNFPNGRTPLGKIKFNELKVNILPSGREIFFESLWSHHKNYTKTSISFSVIKDRDHIKRKEFDANLLIAIRKFF